MAYRINRQDMRTLKGGQGYLAESLEKKLKRVLENGDPIKDKAPLVYTDRKDGVLPDYDIRTDKYEHLVEGFDKAARSRRAKRDGVQAAQEKLDKMNKELGTGTAAKGEGSGGDA